LEPGPLIPVTHPGVVANCDRGIRKEYTMIPQIKEDSLPKSGWLCLTMQPDELIQIGDVVIRQNPNALSGQYNRISIHAPRSVAVERKLIVP
jgi:hypothetical protein